MTGHGARTDAAQSDRGGQHRLVPGRLRRRLEVIGLGQRAQRDESATGQLVGGRHLEAGAIWGRHVQVAPVDAQVVSGLGQDGLLCGAHSDHVQAWDLHTGPNDPLLRCVDGQLGGRVEVDRHVMLAPVSRPCFPRQVRYRTGKHLEIVGKRRGKERHVQPDAGLLEPVHSTGRRDLPVYLVHGRSRRRVSRLTTRAPVRLVIDSDQHRERLFRARPVLRGLVGEPIAHRPDTEIRIVHDQRCRWRAETGGLPR